MNKEFVPYEETLALNKLGFDTEDYFGWYNEDKIIHNYYPTNAVPTPLYQQAFRWFREKYNLHAIFEHDSDNYYYVIQGVNDFDFTTIDGSEENELYLIHEEAELACLKKLIEIVNQNKDE